MKDETISIQAAKDFTNTFEMVFHKDWMYSSAMLSDGTFIDGQTFIEAAWISNWSNKEELIESYHAMKKTLDRNNLNWFMLKPVVTDFVYWFEQVFDEDWEYTKANMTIVEASENDKDFHNKLKLETIYVIANEGTFLHPKLSEEDLEVANWGYRTQLLDNYAIIKALLIA